MRESSWPWALLSVLMVLSLVNGAVPVAAQDDGSDEAYIELPRYATPGTTVTISGQMYDECIPGTGEVGWDPAYDRTVSSYEDPRSGQQASVPVPNGPFSVDLLIPATARGGDMYHLCQISNPEQDLVSYFGGVSPLNTDRAPNQPPDTNDDSDTGGWDVNLPSRAEPGTTLTISGRTPTSCIAGTAEIGWDPDYDWNMQVDDGRSGHQTGVPVPHGSFTIELPLPSTARDGTLYATCERDYGDSPVRTNLRVLQVLDTSGEPPPENSDNETTPPAGEPEITDDLFEFHVRAGTVPLTGTGAQASGLPDAMNGPLLLAAGPDHILGHAPGEIWDGTDLQAIRVPKGAGCHVSTCLWGYFAPPTFKCNQVVAGNRYGSMRGWGYVRKGKADYVRVRPHFFQDGQRIGTGRWLKRTFFIPIGQPWEAWAAVEVHQRFASPGSVYQVAFQAEWYQHRPLRRDVLLAKTPPVAPIPYTCPSAYHF